jgi:hypothetical protein
VSFYTSVVSQFYQMNDITLKWKRLAKSGEKETGGRGQTYNRQEIKQTIDSSDLRTLVLFMRTGSRPLEYQQAIFQKTKSVK